MTEIDRILKKNIITSEFLKEEIICDYKVTTNLKKIWAIELDLLIEFDKFCKIYGLRYYLAFGTLLGAIRHKGFIPWDDDIDICMFRDDYNRMLQHIDFFKEPYFFQTESDNNYGFSFYKLRNTNTTAISYKFMFSGMNEGIFLDIFPIDNYMYTDNSYEDFCKVNQLNIDNSTLMRMNNPNLDMNDKKRIREYNQRSNSSIIDNLKEINKIVTKFNKYKTEFCSIAVCTFYGMDKNIYAILDFKDAIPWEFCGHMFPIPNGFHNILQKTYGNYMDFPPVNKRGLIHSGAYFNPDIDFIEAKEKIINGKIK